MKTRGSEGGNAMLEFALCAMLLYAAVAGLFQYGHALFMYNRLHHAVRAGARYAAQRSYDSASAIPSAAYLSDIRNSVVYGDPAGGSVPVVPGLAPSHVSVTMSMSSVPEAVTVSLDGYPLKTFGMSFVLRGKPRATFRYAGRYAP